MTLADLGNPDLQDVGATGQISLLEYDDQLGRVIIRVDGVPANTTVFRVDPRGVLNPIRGYSQSTAWISGGTGIAYDYEMPLGAINVYVLSLISNLRVMPNDSWDQISVPGNQAWLRDPSFPLLSRKVVVVGVVGEAEPARQTVFPIAGKRRPVVVWDVREGRSGSFVLLVINTYPEDGSRIVQPRDDLETLFSSGNILLLSMCYREGFENLYLAAPTINFTRIGDKPVSWVPDDHSRIVGPGIGWTLDVEYVEVDNPYVDITIPVENTYDMMKDQPTVAATYADWYASYIDYATLLLDRPIGGNP
jgi:hypothetical protein